VDQDDVPLGEETATDGDRVTLESEGTAARLAVRGVTVHQNSEVAERVIDDALEPDEVVAGRIDDGGLGSGRGKRRQ